MILNRILKVLILIYAALSSGGCAVSYTNKLGEQRIIGLVDITLKNVENDTRVAGDTVEITNFGVLFSHNPISTGVSLGYTKESTSKLKNDVMILLEKKKEEENANL